MTKNLSYLIEKAVHKRPCKAATAKMLLIYHKKKNNKIIKSDSVSPKYQICNPKNFILFNAIFLYPLSTYGQNSF